MNSDDRDSHFVIRKPRSLKRMTANQKPKITMIAGSNFPRPEFSFLLSHAPAKNL